MIKDKEFIYTKYWAYVLIIIMVVWLSCQYNVGADDCINNTIFYRKFFLMTNLR